MPQCFGTLFSFRKLDVKSNAKTNKNLEWVEPKDARAFKGQLYGVETFLDLILARGQGLFDWRNSPPKELIERQQWHIKRLKKLAEKQDEAGKQKQDQHQRHQTQHQQQQKQHWEFGHVAYNHPLWQIGLFKRINKESVECTKCKNTLPLSEDSVNQLKQHLSDKHKGTEYEITYNQIYKDLNEAKFDLKQFLDNNFVCQKHINELLIKWADSQTHFRTLTEATGTFYNCAFPITVHGMDDAPTDPHRRVIKRNVAHLLQKKEAQYVLEKHGLLMHLGTPVCEWHLDLIKKGMAEQAESSRKDESHSSDEVMDEQAESSRKDEGYSIDLLFKH
ncbi:hypothetical protein niasHT_014230 [Heterodera trifolii]|uniref:BED-type domain-containing protein n=1 Tax=Heterodera trifolii TaxID=157864 RepID=A0ABD2KX48_9BILA